MSELTDTIVHVAYRFKPEGSDKYITVYLESALQDVLIPAESQPGMLGATNMQEFCDNLMMKLYTEKPLYQKASLYDPKRIYPKDKFLYEADSGRFKVGDGVHMYKDLNYFGYDAGNTGNEYSATNSEVALTITDEHGTETTTVVPDTIYAFKSASEPDQSYNDQAYAILKDESSTNLNV